MIFLRTMGHVNCLLFWPINCRTSLGFRLLRWNSRNKFRWRIICKNCCCFLIFLAYGKIVIPVGAKKDTNQNKAHLLFNQLAQMSIFLHGIFIYYWICEHRIYVRQMSPRGSHSKLLVTEQINKKVIKMSQFSSKQIVFAKKKVDDLAFSLTHNKTRNNKHLYQIAYGFHYTVDPFRWSF